MLELWLLAERWRRLLVAKAECLTYIERCIMLHPRIQRNHEDGKTKWEEYCAVLRLALRCVPCQVVPAWQTPCDTHPFLFA